MDARPLVALRAPSPGVRVRVRVRVPSFGDGGGLTPLLPGKTRWGAAFVCGSFNGREPTNVAGSGTIIYVARAGRWGIPHAARIGRPQSVMMMDSDGCVAMRGALEIKREHLQCWSATWTRACTGARTRSAGRRSVVAYPLGVERSTLRGRAHWEIELVDFLFLKLFLRGSLPNPNPNPNR